MTKSHCDWTHDDYIKNGMVQVFDVTRCRSYFKLNNMPLCRKRIKHDFLDCTCVPDCQNEKIKQRQARYYCRWYREKRVQTVKRNGATRSTSSWSPSNPLSHSAEGIAALRSR